MNMDEVGNKLLLGLGAVICVGGVSLVLIGLNVFVLVFTNINRIETYLHPLFR